MDTSNLVLFPSAPAAASDLAPRARLVGSSGFLTVRYPVGNSYFSSLVLATKLY